MADPAPMPRWYDIPPLWLGWQIAVVFAFVWLVSDVFDVDGPLRVTISLAAVVGVAVVSYRLRRYLRERDDAPEDTH